MNALIQAVFLAAAVLAPAEAAEWDVAAAGAVGDGRKDNTAVFQDLLDRAGRAGGGVVTVPAGAFRIEGNLSIPGNVTLLGIHRVPPTATQGSVLHAVAGRGSTEGPPFIRLAGHNAAVAGLIITYPEWKQTDVPPVPYPPCIAAEGVENTGISECLLLNPYEGIRLAGAARHLVRNITGYPSFRGIYVDRCYDIGRIENVHFWPFGVVYKPEDPYCKWVNTQGTAFEFARTDWHYVLNTFCFGYGVGYKFSESKDGSANGNFLGIGADSCRRAVLVNQAQPPGLLITNGEFVGRWGGNDSVCVEAGPAMTGKVSLVNCSFWGPIDRCVWMRGAGGQFTASACHFLNWDNGFTGSPALQIDGGRAIILGCDFGDGATHVAIGNGVVSAILNANQAPEGFRIDNHAGPRTQSGLNEEPVPIAWTDWARSGYRIHVGRPGDRRYLSGAWHGAEAGYRWCGAGAGLELPVAAGKAATFTLTGHIPPMAIAPDSGLYLEGKRIAELRPGAVLAAELPPMPGDRIQLELRCQGWVPKEHDPKSGDYRRLGVQVKSVEVRAAGAGAGVFDANTGGWLPESAAPWGAGPQ